MNDQQQAAMQMALGAMLTAQNTLIFKCGGDMRPMERETLDDLVEAITSVQMALVQPQESDIEHHRAIKKRNAEVVALEAAQPQGQIKCACGDAYTVDSFGAGFIAATGHCQNCDMAQPQGEWVDLTDDEQYDTKGKPHAGA